MTEPQRRFRVLLLSPATHIGGEEISTLSLARGLLERGHDVGYATSGGPFLPAYEESGARIHELPVAGRGPIGVVRGALALRRTLSDHHYDIIHSQEVFPTVMADLARRFPGRRPTRVIFHYRGVRPEMMPMVGRVIPRISEYVVTNAEVNRELFLGYGADPGKVKTIYNGFDWTPFDEAHDRAALRREWGVPDSAPTVGVVARLKPIKGIRYFLEAAAVVRTRVPDARFLIFGDGPLRDELEARSEKLGLTDAVSFVGWARNIPEALAALDLFVLPSVEEPFGRVLVEAHAAGLAAVSTRVGGTVEIVEEGVTGFFVPAREPEPMAERMVQLLSDPELSRRMGEAGKRRVRPLFGADTMMDQTLEVYRHVCR